MHSTYRLRLIIAFIIILSDFTTAGYCSEGLMDVEKGAHVVVGECRNVGTFSLGGYYDGTWEKLTYLYPEPWEGTFLSIYVNGRIYSNSANPTSVRLDRTNLMDLYVEESPHRIDNKIYTKWGLPENVFVEEIFELMENGTKLYIKIKNKNYRSITVGARLNIDTMLGENDGAPIYIPGDGLKSNEAEYSKSSLDFEYWKAYNKEENATVIASGVLYGEGLTYPDKFLVTDWKRSMYSSWDYEIDPKRTILGDSSVLIYYTPRILEPNETRAIVTVYKKGGPVLPFSKGPLGIADIVSSEVGEEYVPGKNVTMSVDIVTRDIENDTNLFIEVVDKEGNIIYTHNTTKNFSKPDTVNPVKFNLEIPERFTTNDSFEIIASIFKGGKRVDQKSKNFSIAESSEKGSFSLDDVRVGEVGEHSVPIDVDVISTGAENKGNVSIQILSGGRVIYDSIKFTGKVHPDTIKTLSFTWMPVEVTSGSMILKVSLYRDFKKVDEITREFSFRFRLEDIRVGELGEHGIPIEVDVTSIGVENKGELGLEIMKDGKIIYDSMKSTGTVAPNTIKTLSFNWMPEDAIPESMILIVSLYRDFKKVDEIAQKFSLSFPSNESAALNESFVPPDEKEGEEIEEDNNSYLFIIASILLTPLIMILLFLNPLTREKSIETGWRLYDEIEERSRGKGYVSKINALVKRSVINAKILKSIKERRLRDVEIEKMRDGENIKLIIKNNGRRELKNCVVEDKIPKGINISISSPNIFGRSGGLIIIKSDKFVWNIGKLSPGATVILEYRILGGGVLLPARLRWDSGEKITE